MPARFFTLLINICVKDFGIRLKMITFAANLKNCAVVWQKLKIIL